MQLISDFKAIVSDAALNTFLKHYGFVEDTAKTPSKILGVYNATLDGATAKITHSWHDPSGPFQNESDIHKASLEITGHGRHEVAYEG